MPFFENIFASSGNRTHCGYKKQKPFRPVTCRFRDFSVYKFDAIIPLEEDKVSFKNIFYFCFRKDYLGKQKFTHSFFKVVTPIWENTFTIYSSPK